MSKFCTTCGASLDDSATFCTNCGTSLEPSVQAAANAQVNNSGATPAANAAAAVKGAFSGVSFKSVKDAMTMDNIKNITKKPNKNTIIGLAVCGVLVITLIVVLLVILLSGGYKKPIDNLFKSMTSGEGKYAKKAISKVYADYLDDNKKDVDEYLDKTFESIQKTLEKHYGDDVSISWSVDETKDLSSSKLKDEKNRYSERYDEKVTVSDGLRVKIKADIKGDDDEDEDSTMSIDVYKVDGDWVLSLSDCDFAGLAKAFQSASKSSSKYDDYDIDDMDLDDIKDALEDYGF